MPSSRCLRRATDACCDQRPSRNRSRLQPARFPGRPSLLRHRRSRGLLQLAAAVMLAARCGMPGGARRPAHPRSSNCFYRAVGGGGVEWAGGAGSRQQAGQLTAAASCSSPRTCLRPRQVAPPGHSGRAFPAAAPPQPWPAALSGRAPTAWASSLGRFHDPSKFFASVSTSTPTRQQLIRSPCIRVWRPTAPLEFLRI